MMVKAADLGALILPPLPAFYHNPRTIEDLIDQSIGKLFDYFELEHNLFRRWGENGSDADAQRSPRRER